MKQTHPLFFLTLLLASLLTLTACDKETASDSSQANALANAEALAEAVMEEDIVTTVIHASDVLQVENVRIRATPPGQQVTGAFMRISNTSDTAHTLVAAESPIAGVTELHETSMDGDTMRMVKVDRIEIPANEQVELRPGGLHVMLIDLQEIPENGSQHSITLTFSDDSEIVVEGTVMDIMR